MLKCHLVKLWGFKILELFSDYPFLCAQTNLWFMLKLRLKVGPSPDSLQQSWCCCPPWWLTCHWLDNTPSWTCYNPGSGKHDNYTLQKVCNRVVLTCTPAMRASDASDNASVPLIMINRAGPALDKSAVTTDHTSARCWNWSHKMGMGTSVNFIEQLLDVMVIV